MIDKEQFIDKVLSLEGSYFDYGRCLYLMAKQNGILDEVADFAFHKAKSSYDLDEKVYELMGHPDPLPIVAAKESRRVRQLAMA